MGGIQGWDANGILREILTDALGRLLVGIDLPLPAGANNIGDVDVLSIAAGTNLIGRVDARNGDKLRSFKAAYAESIVNTSAAAGTNTLTSSAVPANTIRRIYHVAAYNVNTNPASVEIYGGYIGVVSLPLVWSFLPGANRLTIYAGQIVLRAGDTIFATLTGCALNDDIVLRLAGEDESV